jgi:acetyl-CoA acetyltransferase
MREVVIVAAVRTPMGKYGGALKDVRPDDLAALVIREVVRRAGIDPAMVDEVYMGCANQAGEDNRNVARMAAILAGFPYHVAAVTVNRLCASGLTAVNLAARTIRCGEADVVVAGGVESMTRAPWVMPKAAVPFRGGTSPSTTPPWGGGSPTRRWRPCSPSSPWARRLRTSPRSIRRSRGGAGPLRPALPISGRWRLSAPGSSARRSCRW